MMSKKLLAQDVHIPSTQEALSVVDQHDTVSFTFASTQVVYLRPRQKPSLFLFFPPLLLSSRFSSFFLQHDLSGAVGKVLESLPVSMLYVKNKDFHARSKILLKKLWAEEAWQAVALGSGKTGR